MKSQRKAGPSRNRQPAAEARAPAIARPGAWSERHFRVVLAAICALGLVCRGVILWDYLSHSPLAAAPVVDAKVYWEWAGRIATGRLVDDVPFFSAPLYPYLLGVVRAVDGSLTTVYVLQIVTDLATAVLLALAGRARFGAWAGLLAAVLFLLLQDPASFSLRILTCTLQLVLLAAVYLQLIRVQQAPSVGRHVALGATLGLLCLSWPPAMLLAVAVVAWRFWQSRRRAGGAVLPLLVSAVLIAPATLYNWYVSGNLFFIQAVSGINLLVGNQPASTGGFTPLPNITTGRGDMFREAARQYAVATGKPGTWAEVNRYYRNQALDFWRRSPLATLKLLARKLYMFLSWQNYGEIYQPATEIAFGWNPWLRLAPLPVPWLIGPALVALLWMLRRPVHYAPEWLLFLLPLFVTLLFWYSSRYRVLAVPVIAVAAASCAAPVLARRTARLKTIVAGLALAAGMALGPVNRALGTDVADPTYAMFNAGAALQQQGQNSAAVDLWRRVVQVCPGDAAARISLGDLLSSLGRHNEALAEYERARTVEPGNVRLPGRIAESLFQQQRYAEAEQVLSGALARDSSDGTLLGLLARTKQAQGQLDEAAQLFGRAVQAAPADAGLHAAYGDLLLRASRWAEAREEFARAVQITPDDADAYHRLGVVEAQLGNVEQARASFERSLTLRPNSAPTWHDAGLLSLQVGRLDDAAECFHRALRLDPNRAASRQMLRQIDQLRAAQSRPAP
jgi:tetratricopeptide (TPR) repeat protein